MGLQAALAGKQVFTIRFSDYVVYPKFGLSQEVDSFEEALGIIKQGKCSAQCDPKNDFNVGSATGKVLDLIDEIRFSVER